MLLMLHKAQGHGAYVCSAISLTVFTLPALMFVEDRDLMEMDRSAQDTLEVVGEWLARAAMDWACTLRTTGGLLRADKCFWYLIYFIWLNGEYHHQYVCAIPAAILVPDISGRLEVIDRHEPSASKEVMGVFQAPDGNMADHLKDLG